VATRKSTRGSGKTHLGLEIGRHLAGTFSAGLCWVDLAPLAEPQLVVPTIARHLGLLVARLSIMSLCTTVGQAGRRLVDVHVDDCRRRHSGRLRAPR
jgi:predicted ATPase